MFTCIKVYVYKLLCYFFLSFMSHRVAWGDRRISLLDDEAWNWRMKERERTIYDASDTWLARTHIYPSFYDLRFTRCPVQPEVDGHGHWRQSCEACKRRLGVSAENELFQRVINAAVKVDRCEGMKKGTRRLNGY